MASNSRTYHPEMRNGLETFPPNVIGYSTQMSREEHYRGAAVSGGWYVLHPLRRILKATAPTQKDVEWGFPPLLREGQTEWMVAPLERLKKIYLLGVPSPTSS
jgi:hypothetical protein